MENINISRLPLIGQGVHGKVYKIDENRCIKVCKDIKDMQMEYAVLKHAEGYPQFPKVYECKKNYMIREYIDGQNIRTYIKRNGLDNNIARGLTELIKVFIRLNFTRIDIRMAEVFVTANNQIRIVDTTRYMDKQASYPKKMLKNLNELGYLKQYMYFLKENYPEFYNSWR
ncbi:MAG TPA: AarF/UbiB family protein [Clostridiaceae bacterium]